MAKYKCSADSGAAAELLACHWLMGLGYQVFRNVSPAGPADIVAWCPDTGETLMIDVKSANGGHVRADGEITFPVYNNQPDSGVHHLHVLNGNVVGFVGCRTRGERSIYLPARARLAEA